MILELHLLQNFAPSCLNRDDANAPKDCEFGGVRRARISSQCLKRALRWHPEFAASQRLVGSLRTKRLAQQLCDDLSSQGYEAEALQRLAPPLVERLVGKLGPDGRSRVLAHIGRDEIARLEALIAEHWDELLRALAPAREDRVRPQKLLDQDLRPLATSE